MNTVELCAMPEHVLFLPLSNMTMWETLCSDVFGFYVRGEVTKFEGTGNYDFYYCGVNINRREEHPERPDGPEVFVSRHAMYDNEEQFVVLCADDGTPVCCNIK